MAIGVLIHKSTVIEIPLNANAASAVRVVDVPASGISHEIKTSGCLTSDDVSLDFKRLPEANEFSG